MADSTRPTLPPLHTLNLPRGDIPLPRVHELHDLNEQNRPTKQLHVLSTQPSCHQPPISSSTTSTNLSPPAPCLRPCNNTPLSISTSATPFPILRIRLVPTSFENADAVVLVSPPTASNTPPPQPLFLIGPALQRLRHRQRQVAKGVRVHPYRIARGPSDRRPPTDPTHTKA